MGPEEILIILLIFAVLAIVPVAALIIAIIALVRSGRLSRRLNELERRLVLPRPETPEAVMAQIVPEAPAAAFEHAEPATAVPEVVTTGFAESPDQPSGDARGWEAFIGQKAFGWVAMVLLVFAATFFLRYAYQNNWIGPVGRVSIAELAGAALGVAGWRYYRRGWRRYSVMLTAAGVVVLYLATYSAFGFYHLLPQHHAGAFLAVVIAESMIVAVIYDSAVVALVAVIGGLLTPLLMHSHQDSYAALFTYLAILDAGVIATLVWRSWIGIGSLAFLGTHGLFWMWYDDNYHPEKFSWAIGFQALVFALFLAHSLFIAQRRARQATWEDLTRFVLNAVLWFGAYYVLTVDDYRPWLGTTAVAMATLYAVVARVTLAFRPQDNRLLLTALAVATGFIAWAIPIQADARWVSLGWAAMGAALWWFGLRIAAPALRTLSGVLAAAAVVRLLALDLPLYTRDPFIPIFNGFAIPSLGVAVCILAAVLSTRRFQDRVTEPERFLVACAGIAGVLLVWLILSVECFGYFDSQSIGTTDVVVWRWRGQLALTVLWAVYATTLLILGFRYKFATLRWLSFALYGLTVVKLFVVDMANVQQLYRILAFFVLAVVLGLVARAYQRFK